jgi:predicted HicB family RNase H-like nuclease
MVKKKEPSLADMDASVGNTEPEQQKPEMKKAGRPKEIHYSLDKKFTLMLPKEVHKALKIKSAELEIPMTTMIIDAIKKTYNIF